MPGTRWPRWKATCSTSAKKFVGLASSVSRPIGLDRRQLLGHDLGRVEQVDPLEHLVLAVLEDLDAELPLRERAGLDGVVEVAAVEVRVETAQQLGLLPRQRVHTQHGLPVELHQRRAALGVGDSRKVCTPKPSMVR